MRKIILECARGYVCSFFVVCFFLEFLGIFVFCFAFFLVLVLLSFSIATVSVLIGHEMLLKWKRRYSQKIISDDSIQCHSSWIISAKHVYYFIEVQLHVVMDMHQCKGTHPLLVHSSS